MPKKKRDHSGGNLRHAPLASQTQMDELSKRVDQKGISRQQQRQSMTSENPDDESYRVPVSVSRKVLQLAREQQDEVDGEEARARANVAGIGGGFKKTYEDDEMESGNENGSDIDDNFATMDDDGYVDGNIEEVNEEDAAAYAQFMGTGSAERRTLGDIIAEKLRQTEMQQEQQKGVQGGGGMVSSAMNEKVVAVYTSVGQLLTRYRAGKVPKAFKVIPALRNWEEVLWITNPSGWSAQAMFVATKIFASQLKPKHAQRFYNIVLLRACREDIRSNKKLNYHLYSALRKSVYKPAAFFKGILLPLAETSCTLREALIVGSVLSKVSIPMMHSAAALLKLTEMPYNGAMSIFMTVLMNKKYSLPFKVLDALADHFTAFDHDNRTLPVLWHQSLLVFAQRYKLNLTKEQKNRLRNTLRIHQHPAITGEIRRELFNSTSRGEKKMDTDVEMQ